MPVGQKKSGANEGVEDVEAGEIAWESPDYGRGIREHLPAI